MWSLLLVAPLLVHYAVSGPLVATQEQKSLSVAEKANAVNLLSSRSIQEPVSGTSSGTTTEPDEVYIAVRDSPGEEVEEEDSDSNDDYDDDDDNDTYYNDDDDDDDSDDNDPEIIGFEDSNPVYPRSPNSLNSTTDPSHPHSPNSLETREMKEFQLSALTLTVYQQIKCQNQFEHKKEKNVVYGVNYNKKNLFRAYKLSRDLEEGEQLDFSQSIADTALMPNGARKMKMRVRTVRGGESGQGEGAKGKRENNQERDCARFVVTAENDARLGKTCHQLPRVARCFRFWHH